MLVSPHSAPAIGCSTTSINSKVYPVPVAARAQRASVEPVRWCAARSADAVDMLAS